MRKHNAYEGTLLMQLWRSLPSLGTGSLAGKPPAQAGPPVLLSGRAAERLARVQHLGAAPDRAGLHGAQLAAVVLQHPVTAPVPGAAASGGSAASRQTKGWRRDTDSELAVTAGTLHRLCLFHGSFVQARCFPVSASTLAFLCSCRHQLGLLWYQVSNPGRPEVAPHVARILACDAEPAGLSGADDAAPGHTCKPYARQWRDGTAYLAPQLAFNLGLPYHLAPFLPLHAPLHDPNGDPAARPCGIVALELLQALPAAPASGSAGGGARERRPWGGAPQPGTASTVTVACLMEPDASLLRRGGSSEGDGDAARGPGDPESGPAEVDRAGMLSPAGGPASDTGGESVVAALRRHFLTTPRREQSLDWIIMHAYTQGASSRCLSSYVSGS